MVLYNILGGVMFLIAVLVGWGVDAMSGGGDINFYAVGVVAIALDLGWRLTRGAALLEAEKSSEKRLPARMRRKSKSSTPQVLIVPRAGGHVFFVPVWGAALLMFVIALLDI